MKTLYKKQRLELRELLLPAYVLQKVCWFLRSVDPNYRAADKSLARPTSRCILFDGENISFDASLVMYINSNNILPIMIINRICETQNILSL
jgi:hypothetical protein